MRAVTAVADGFVAVGLRGAEGETHVSSFGTGLSPTEGLGGTFVGEFAAAVWLSPDGPTWTRVEDPTRVFGGDGPQAMADVVSDNGKLVAVGFRASEGDPDAAVWLSDDGRIWRPSSASAAALQQPDRQLMRAATIGPQGLVAAGFAGAPFDLDAAVWTSP